MPTRKIEVAQLPSLAVEGFALIGPLTAAAVAELVFRVKAMRMVGNTTLITFAEESIAMSVDQTARYDAALDELDMFGATPFADFNDQPEMVGEETLEYRAIFSPVTPEYYPFGESFEKHEVFQTPDKQFYLRGSFSAITSDGAFFTTYGIGGDSEYFSGQLILKSGTFPTAMQVSSYNGSTSTGSSFTATATEWFPFATSAGLDAWDTATGLPINGGP